MKLKYYLRGVGIGIIFATLVMTLSCVVHNYNLSDEYIIKEAMKLGMVMKDDLNSEDGLWGGDDTEEDTSIETEGASNETENTESTQVTGSEAETSESESQSQPNPEPEPQVPVVPDEPTSESQTPAYATITIVRGDYARQVGEKLFAAGLVDDAEAFRVYMGEHGYAHSIHAGTYQIPFGATFEEICKMVAG